MSECRGGGLGGLGVFLACGIAVWLFAPGNSKVYNAVQSSDRDLMNHADKSIRSLSEINERLEGIENRLGDFSIQERNINGNSGNEKYIEVNGQKYFLEIDGASVYDMLQSGSKLQYNVEGR